MPNDDSTPTEPTPERRLEMGYYRAGAHLILDLPEDGDRISGVEVAIFDGGRGVSIYVSLAHLIRALATLRAAGGS